MKVKIFADGADKQIMLEMYNNPLISGLTTNPTLMKKAGITNYKEFALDILSYIKDKSISFEVFSDDFDNISKLQNGRAILDEGEIYFRELEIEAIKQTAARKKQVIACGGGVVLNTININRLRDTGVIVNLVASPATILKRTTSDGVIRPLLNVKQPGERIRALLKFRKPFYDRAADFTINTSKLNIDAVAEKIINRLKNYEGFNF